MKQDTYAGDLAVAGVTREGVSMLKCEAPAGCVSRIPMGGGPSSEAGARYVPRRTRVLYDQMIATACETHAMNRRPRSSFKQRWQRYVEVDRI